MKSSSLEHSEEGHAFLQRRVALYGFHGANIGLALLVFRIVESVIHGHVEWTLYTPSVIYHFLGAMSFVAMWLLCRGRPRSVRFIRAVEGVGTFFACGFYTLMGYLLPPFNRPEFIILLALSLGMVARAIYVPSSARRTLLIMALSGLPLLWLTYDFYSNISIEDVIDQWVEAAPWISGQTETSLALAITAWALAWWVASTTVCTAASHVIYGLRKEVRDVKKLGRYTLVEKLGEGGMGMVYRAQHAMLRRPTAVKLLPVEKAGERSIARFEKEVQLTAMLTHPNTVTIFDYGRTPDGVFYYAMEYLNGATLAGVIEAGGRMPPARTVHILMQAADALAEAHEAGLIHRDIKPTNIMLIEQGGHPDVAKVVDFGLVKELEHGEDASLTKADAITGTPQYLAPEAITSADHVDARSDLYALGAVGYFLLTGTHVFEAPTMIEVCSAHLHETPTPMSQRLGEPVPKDLEAVIMSCLAKNPDDRPQSAVELYGALASCRVGEWSMRDARSWWERHGDAIESGRDRASGTASDLTLDIDMARHRGAA